MTNVPNWLAALSILVPAVTLVVGYWLAGRNEENRDIRALAREREARRAALHDQAVDRRHEFQRDLLLELQDVLRLYMRGVVRLVRFDQQTLREHREFRQLGDELNKETDNASVDFLRLRVRVLDDRLRGELEDLHREGTKLEMVAVQYRNWLPDRADEVIDIIESQFIVMSVKVVEANETLGDLLRTELGRIPDEALPQASI